jgi:hypothetical protein
MHSMDEPLDGMGLKAITDDPDCANIVHQANRAENTKYAGGTSNVQLKDHKNHVAPRHNISVEIRFATCPTRPRRISLASIT